MTGHRLSADRWQALENWRGAELGEPIEGGSVNDVRHVTRAGEQLVARMTTRAADDLGWETELLTYLSRAGLGVPELIPADDGRLHADGLVVMSYVEGEEPRTETDRQRLGAYLRDLHQLTKGWGRQRPGWRATPELLHANCSGPMDLSAVPEDVAAVCKHAWSRLIDHPMSVIHGDPNPTNVRLQGNQIVLLDWDEARLDVSILDLAARGPSVPDLAADDRHVAEQALHAWEACLFWNSAPDYAKRRFAQLDNLI